MFKHLFKKDRQYIISYDIFTKDIPSQSGKGHTVRTENNGHSFDYKNWLKLTTHYWQQE